MTKKSKLWKQLLSRGVKKDVFMQLLKERHPKGQFTFGDALHAYEDAHHILDLDGSPPTGVTGVRDILNHAGALFEFHTHGRQFSREGWPSTKKTGLVTMPKSPKFKPIMRKIITAEIEAAKRTMDTYGPTEYGDRRVHDLRKELQQYS